MHDKMPTDDHLQTIGCVLTYVYSLCKDHSEVTHHLFFTYVFYLMIWTWLENIIKHNLYFNSTYDLWSFCNNRKSP